MLTRTYTLECTQQAVVSDIAYSILQCLCMFPKSETNVMKVKVILSAQLPYVCFSFSLLSLERTYVLKFDTTATEAISVEVYKALRPGCNSQCMHKAKHLLARNEPYRDTGFYNGQTIYNSSRAASRVDVCEVTEMSTRWLHC